MEHASYEQINREHHRLYDLGRYKEAAEVLLYAWDRFPDKLFDMSWNRAVACAQAGEHDKALEMFEYGLSRGFFYELEWDIFDPLREHARYARLVEQNERRLAQAQAGARMEYEVHTPAGYTAVKSYPLFMALHGDGSDIAWFKNHWQPETMLEQGFVVVYVQSSRVVCMDGFAWTLDYEQAMRDLCECHARVVEQYAVDTENVIIGGFSGGAIAAVEALMRDAVPLRGFVALCLSAQPDSFSAENAAKAAGRGARGVIMEGDLDELEAAEQEMLAVLDEVGFPYQFYVNEGVGHSFPEDFAGRLARAVRYISGEE